MKKRILSLFMSACILLTSVAFISAKDISQQRQEEALQEQETLQIEKQGESLTTYFAVKDALEANRDTYGGVYIDDNGDLNIMIVDTSNSGLLSDSGADCKMVRDYQDIIAEEKTEEQSVVYRMVPYSLKYLEGVQSNLMDNSEELKIVSTYIDETRNKIVVGYSDDSFSERSVIDFAGSSDLVAFEGTTGIKNLSVIKNGSRVTRPNQSQIYFSIACGAKIGNKYGFITAGHCGNVGDAEHYNGVYFGSITNKIDGGNVDVAFIERASSLFQSTTKFTDSTAYKAGMSNYGNGAIYVMGGWPTGSTVVAYGATTIRSSGKIISTKFSCISDTAEYNNMVLTTCKGDKGDSGGAVKAIITYQGITTTYCAGIIKANVPETGNMVYTDMDFAKSTLGFVGYYDTTGVK